MHGERRTRTAKLSILAVVGLVIAMAPSDDGPARAAPRPSDIVTLGLTLSRSVGPPTTRIVVAGTGFGVDEIVDVSFDGTELAEVHTDPSGSFSGARLKVPASARPGTHTVSARGRTSGVRSGAPFLVRTDWPQYRGGPERLGFNRFENVLSVSNVDRLDRVWTFDTGSEVYASPTVVDGILYSGSGFVDGQTYALDASSGDLVWDASLGAEAPAVRDGVAYAAHGDVDAVDASTGEPIWSYPGGEDGFLSGVALVQDVVYAVAYRGEVVALDATDGTLLWSRSVPDSLWAAPTVARGALVVGTPEERVYSVDASTGATRWKLRSSSYILNSAAVAHGVVYIGAEDRLYALDAKTGDRIWRTSRVGAGTTPAVVGGVVYLGTGHGDVDAYDASTGDLVWRFHAGGGDVESSPTVANGVVYVGSNGDMVFALDARTGAELWSFRTGLGIQSSPTVVDGMLYVGSKDGKIYAFGLG